MRWMWVSIKGTLLYSGYARKYTLTLVRTAPWQCNTQHCMTQ